MIVCLDTNILIWGIKGEAPDKLKKMIPKTKAFISWIHQEQKTIIIPSFVLAEFLMGVPVEDHAMMVELLSTGFILTAFDTRAALQFVKIWRTKQNQEILQKLQKEGMSKHKIKIDGMIVATAVSRKAECIYSHDSGLKEFAKGWIEVKEIPNIPIEKDLFPNE